MADTLVVAPGQRFDLPNADSPDCSIATSSTTSRVLRHVRHGDGAGRHRQERVTGGARPSGRPPRRDGGSVAGHARGVERAAHGCDAGPRFASPIPSGPRRRRSPGRRRRFQFDRTVGGSAQGDTARRRFRMPSMLDNVSRMKRMTSPARRPAPRCTILHRGHSDDAGAPSNSSQSFRIASGS